MLPATQLMPMDIIEEFVKKCGHQGTLSLCAKDMSNRVYYRLETQNQSFIIMAADPNESPERFIAVSEFLISHGIAAPKVLFFDQNQSLVLLEDFGNQTFSKALGDDIAVEGLLYREAIHVLKALHKLPRPFFVESYDIEKLLKEVEVFIDWYWPYSKGNKAPDIVKNDFMGLWREVFEKMPKTPQTLVLRDYHCDNLMLIGNISPKSLNIHNCGVLDFQDALWGSVAYDFVSLVEDARRNVSKHVVEECATLFLSEYSIQEIEAIQKAGIILSAGRHTKVLGVFSRYALRQNNTSKCIHNPRIWGYLDTLFEDSALSELKRWFRINFPSSVMVRK